MAVKGYLTLAEVAQQLQTEVAAVERALAPAGVTRFQIQGQIVIRDTDLARLKPWLNRPPAKPSGSIPGDLSTRTGVAPVGRLGAPPSSPGSDRPVAGFPGKANPAVANSEPVMSASKVSPHESVTLSEAELEALLGPAGGSGVFDPDNPAALLMNEEANAGASAANLVPKTFTPVPAAASAASQKHKALNSKPQTAPEPSKKPVTPAALRPRPTLPQELIIDNRHQLFLDSTSLAQMKNVKRVINQPEKFAGNPVIVPDTPWEEDGLCTLGGSVLYDPEEMCYKMWYYAVTQLGRACCFAFSPDGLKWEKPNLGIVKHGERDTNIVMLHPHFEHYSELLGVVRDENDPDDNRRYKAVFLKSNSNGVGRTLRTAISPDGFIWSQLSSQIGDVSETGHFTRDHEGRYVVYARSARAGRRSVSRFESDDFLDWTAGELVLAPDEKDPENDDIYSLAAFPFGNSYVGLVQMYHGPPHYTLDIQLASSRDGFVWERALDRAVFLPTGGPGCWDRFQLSMASQPVAVGERELWFYYGCRLQRHAPYMGADKGTLWGGIGVARLRMDGFAHLETSFDGGTAVTPTLRLKHPELHLNVAAASGVLGVSLLDADGKAIPNMVSAPISSDGVNLTVIWPGGRNLADFVGKPIRIAFAFKNARLYSFWTQ